MRRGRTVLVLAFVVAVAACGGAVAFDDATGDTSVSSRPPRGGGGGGRPGFDASRYPYDAAPPSCACETELEQLDGSCDFTIGEGLIECVADHSDGGSYAPLGTAVSLATSTLSSPASTLTIACFTYRPETTAVVYMSDEVIDRLGTKYRQ